MRLPTLTLEYDLDFIGTVFSMGDFVKTVYMFDEKNSYEIWYFGGKYYKISLYNKKCYEKEEY